MKDFLLRNLKLFAAETVVLCAFCAAYLLLSPMAGDALYGGHTDLIGRQALHCGVLILPDPAGGKERRITSPLPPDALALFPEGAAFD